jgi:hypothetical protein
MIDHLARPVEVEASAPLDERAGNLPLELIGSGVALALAGDRTGVDPVATRSLEDFPSEDEAKIADRPLCMDDATPNCIILVSAESSLMASVRTA